MKTFVSSLLALCALAPTALAHIQVSNPAFPPAAPPAPSRLYTLQELAPYFSEGALRQAREAFDKAQYTRARTLLADQGEAPPVRYLRALSALRAGDEASAAAEFSALAQEWAPMRDRCLTYAGLSYEALGQLDEALAVLTQVSESSRSWAEARMGMARVLRRKKDFEGALAALQPVLESSSPWARAAAPDVLQFTADLHADRKDRAAEREALGRLWGLYPLSSEAKAAERRLAGAPLLVEWKVNRGEQLIEAHRNRQGMAVLEPLLPGLKLPDPLACRARFAYGKALRKERLHTRAIAMLDLVAEQCEDPQLLPRALYVLGFSRSIVDPERGVETYKRLAREFPEHSFADDALFHAAELEVKTGHPERAAELLQELARLYPQGDFLGEALFKAFWIARTTRAEDGGLPLLQQLEERLAQGEETYDVERARYWRARTLQERGEVKAAADLFEQLMLDHPTTYYGLLARTQMGELEPERLAQAVPRLTPSPERVEPWPLEAGPLAVEPRFLSAVELLRMGFEQQASSELLSLERARLPRESVRLLVHLLALAGEERAAHGVARLSLRRDLSGPITPETRPLWEVAYPNAFRPLIEKHTAPAGVEPDLLQALMREESALDPKALSWAGALGLTQLMPSTAREVARQLKLKHFSTEALLEPELNIRMGAWYLGVLLKQFSGNAPYAVGSYNAGAGAVNRWRKERPELPLDAWVEEIPIAETRGYIKRVLRSYNTYQLLYGRPAKLPAVRSTQL